MRTISTLPPAGRKSESELGKPLASTHVSLLPPPRCIDTTSEFFELETRVSPPGSAK